MTDLPEVAVPTGGEVDSETEAPPEPPETMRVVSVVGVTVELPSTYPEIVLREVAEPWREMRFRIGYAEGVAMSHAWRRLPSPRPLTHEVWADILGRVNVTMEAVRIVDVQDGVYCAEMVLAGAYGTMIVPCRPTDALTLSMRQQFSVPILVAERVIAGTQSS